VANQTKERKAQLEAEMDARVERIAERARANGTARAESPVEVRIDPSIIGTGTPREPERKVIQRPHVEPPPAPPRRMREARDDAEGGMTAEPTSPSPEPPTSVPRAAPKFDRKTCALDGCGAEFTPRSGRQRFCTVRCQERDKTAKRSPGLPERTCKWEGCDNVFQATQARQTYCSDECRIEATRKLKREDKRARRSAGAPERERYIDFLFELAERDPTPEILDRIEKAVGIS
jgi:hypothetical protein